MTKSLYFALFVSYVQTLTNKSKLTKLVIQNIEKNKKKNHLKFDFKKKNL